MFDVMESLGIDYKFYEAVIMVLLLLIGGIFGALIGGREKKEPKKETRNHSEFRIPNSESNELPSIGSVRHGEKVVICGAEWTIM